MYQSYVYKNLFLYFNFHELCFQTITTISKESENKHETTFFANHPPYVYIWVVLLEREAEFLLLVGFKY